MPAPRLTLVQWLICIIAVIGFAFDTYVLLMLPLILRPSLTEFGITPGSKEFAFWLSMLFFVPAFVGGFFGLLGGYLTDRLGRRRVLTWSILIYAVSAFAASYSTSVVMLLVFRCTSFIGVCVEFVAAVAWLAELFPNPHQRERVLGYTQACSSFGGLLVAAVNGWAIKWAATLPAIGLPDWLSSLGVIKDPHAAWRYTLMSGLIPAIPLILIRPFLPESPTWKQKKLAGTLTRPSIRELFAPQLRRTTIITTLMFALSFGAAFGAIQQMPQIATGMPDVVAQTAGKPVPAQKQIEQKAASDYAKVQEIGGLIGRFLLALLVVRIVSRRTLLRIFQIPGLIVLPLAFGYMALNNHLLFTIGSWNVTLFDIGIFLAGLFTVAQFSFWGNYLPRAFPLHLRGTGEGFAANIGGRMIGTSFAALSGYLASQSFMPGKNDAEKMAFTAAAVGFSVYLLGLLLSFFLPEPKQELSAD
ncbi:MAG TPA: MFS transporter [Pirellulales bacterium]|jgi:MFS family permease